VLFVYEVTPPLMAAYADELESAGFGVLRVTCDAPNPAKLVAIGLPAVHTTYAARLDADTIIDLGFATAVGALQQSGAQLASTRIEAYRPRSIIAKLQGVEYRIAMLSRRYRPWLTSGACFIGRTEALRAVFAMHTQWTPGEDIETGRVALALGMKIYHVDYVAYTEVPETTLALFHQRRMWWAGNFRHMVMNADRNLLQMPAITLYTLLGVWTTLSMHVWNMFSVGLLVHGLPLALAFCVLVTMVVNVQAWSPWMVVFPIYSLVQSTLMPPLGAIEYAVLAWRRRDLGRYRFSWAHRRFRPKSLALTSAP
jgi:cellulose synthase/poly-beta-1,6-N-acetylglucosamine synthase-like glycosyltransferase